MGKESDTWLDGVVLRATPALVFNVELPHLSIGNLLSFLIGAIQQSGPYHQPGTRGRAMNTWLVLEVCVDEAKTVIDHDFFIVLTVLLNIVSGPIGNAIELPQEVKHLP